MAAGGFSLTEFPTKEAAIASAADKLRVMGGGVVELIQVGDLHPASPSTGRPARPAERPAGVVPYLAIEGAADAAAFYQRAFRAREVARMAGDDGRLVHCHLEINGGALMLADPPAGRGGAPVERTPSDRMQLVVDDGQVWWDRAIAAGCTATLPFGPAPWGDLYGQLVDPFGVSWAIAAPAR